jgi:hypothetical protein
MNLEDNQAGYLLVEFSEEKGLLKITILDNGVGRMSTKKNKNTQEHESVGSLFSSKRIEMLKASNGKTSEMIITDLHNTNGSAAGTRVDIYLSM